MSVVSTPESTWFVGLGGDLQNFTSVTPTGAPPTTQSITVVGDSDADVNGTVQFEVENIGAAPTPNLPVTIAAPDCEEATTTVADQTTTVTASPPARGSGGVSPSLPATGSETEWLTLFGLLTLAAGLLAVGYARRPSSS